ncbi:MAG: DUF732 domain-containing protein [Mycobacterium sp.]
MATKRLGIAAAVMVTSLVVAVPAHADPDNDFHVEPGDEFLAMLSEEGLDVGHSGADVQLTLASAEMVCHLLHYDFTAEDAGRYVGYQFPKATPQQLAGFVEAAQTKLCPLAYAPVYPGW